MKGEKAENIKGPFSTLSNDKLPTQTFDYMISNPPYGRDWETDEDEVKAEAELGFKGRFGAGLPRKSDGQFLFIQHMISKMKTNDKSKIAVITNGSPLFTGDAGSGESEIRKWIIENDYLEALIALPTDLFFNTSIGTYIWVLTNRKSDVRKGKVQLIDARQEYVKRKKPLGKKAYKVFSERIKATIFFEKVESEEDKLLKEKEIETLKSSIERREKLLSNDNYVNKAPSNIVELDRKKLEEEKKKLEELLK